MKKLLTLFFVTAFVVAAFPDTRTFSGTGSFSETSKWDVYPTTGDDLVVDGACTMSEDSTTQYATITVNATKSLNINTCTLRVTGSTINGSMSISGSAVSGFACVDFTAATNSLTLTSGSKLWVSGDITFSGSPWATTNPVGLFYITASASTVTIDFGTSNPKIYGLTFAAPTGVIHIAANFQPRIINGTAGTVISSVSGTRRVLSTTSTGTATGMTFKDISLGYANRLNAKTGCTNLGNNLGIVFKDTSR